MKKLLTMMVAVCALGAYAEEWAGKQFSDFENGLAGDWTTTSQDTTLEVKDYESPEDGNLKYLAIETDANDAAVKEISDDQQGRNVYVDTLVKFTPFDKEPEIEGAKIAVWYLAQDAEGEEGQDGYVPGQTNLMVTAGKLNASGGADQEKIALDVSDFDVNAWHQLKIESKGSIVTPEAVKLNYSDRLGFTITLDGVQVAAKDDSLTKEAADYLTKEAEDLGAQLFPSVIADDLTIASLAINGSGSIDNLTIDAKEAATEIQVDLSALEGDGYTVTADPEQAHPGDKIEITFTADKGYLFANGEAEIVVNGTLNKDGTVTGEGVEPQKTAEIVVVADGYDYISLVDAFAAAVLEGELDEFEIDVKRDCQYEDGFALATGDDFLITGEITVDKSGIKLMTEDSYIEGLDDSVDFIQSGVEGFVAKFEDDVWKLVEAEPTEVLPEATVKSIEEEDYEVAVQFDAGNIGAGYENWIAKFYLTSDVTIGEGEIRLGGNYGTYGWVDKDYTCTADVPQSVLAVVGLEDDITVKTVFEDIQSFKCGVKNIELANDATFTLKLVITDPEGVKEDIEICSQSGLKVAKKATEPTIPEEEGKIEPGENEGEYIVTPAEGKDEIDIKDLPAEAKVVVPGSVNKVTGATIANIIVKNGEYDITKACTISEAGVIALDEKATVQVGTEQIPVKPVLSDATDEVKPLVVGETTAVGVKAIPGLKYELVRSETIGGEQKAVASEMATGARVTLTDKFDGGKPASAFYVIKVTK